ncbi:MAG: FecR domain-containing protein [Nannocystaceae bacterium]
MLTHRASSGVEALYDAHLQACADCRRFASRLRATYEGPPQPSTPDLVSQTREFAQIMGRVDRNALRRPGVAALTPLLRAPAAAAGLAATAMGVVVLLLNPSIGPSDGSSGTGGTAMGLAGGSLRAPHDTQRPMAGGIEHHSQTFGRVVAGRGLLQRSNGDTIRSNSFAPGSKFETTADPLQVSLAGKLLATFQPGASVSWDNASPTRIQLTLERGLIAIRYDREEDDPELLVHTPTGIVRVLGTVFTVEVDDHRDTLVSVLRGRVEVLDAKTKRHVAAVEAGYRFEMATSTVFDVSHREVEAALALSHDAILDEAPVQLPFGHVPESWVVPGLPSNPEQRILANVPEPSPVDDNLFKSTRKRPRYARRNEIEPDLAEDAILRELVERAQRSIEQAEISRDLERCRELYASAGTRFLAANCLSKFLQQFGDNPNAVEGRLLLGILRMDFAQDYQVAERELKRFLAQAPNHKLAELAVYKLWLGSTEDGQIATAVTRGRAYLRRYPNGRYVGRILRRFPELKSEL